MIGYLNDNGDHDVEAKSAYCIEHNGFLRDYIQYYPQRGSCVDPDPDPDPEHKPETEHPIIMCHIRRRIQPSE